jgi:hypothetical protein
MSQNVQCYVHVQCHKTCNVTYMRYTEKYFLLHSCYIDGAVAHAGHSCAQTQEMCPPPRPPTREGRYPIQAPHQQQG